MAEQQAGYLTVERQYTKDTQAEGETTQLQVRTFKSAPARVKCSYGTTINLGNYESARLDVSVELPCYPEEIGAAYEAASAFCTDTIRVEVAKVKARKAVPKKQQQEG